MVFDPFGSSSADSRREHHVDTEGREQSLVIVGGARVGLELGGVREPQRVHEHRHDDDVGDLAGAVDEVDMAVVERADGGDERDPGPVRCCGSGLSQSGAQPVDGADHPLIVAVGASPGRGPRVGERVVDRGMRERREVCTGIRHAGLGEKPRRLLHDRARELGCGGDALGVRRPVVLGDDDRLAPELDGERLCDREHRGGRGHRGVGAAQLAAIDRGPGEGDGRVDGERDRPLLSRGGQDAGAEGRIGVQHELPRLPRAEFGEAGDEPAELVVRHRDDHQLAPAHHLEGIEQRHAREHRLDPARRPSRA